MQVQVSPTNRALIVGLNVLGKEKQNKIAG